MPMPTMAELVNELFHTHLRPDGREFTNREVCRALDGALEPSYLGKIRSGKVENPTRNTLLLLCRFFQAPPSYFFPELQQPSQETLLSDEEIEDALALRSREITPEARVYLSALVRLLKGLRPK